MNILTKIKKHLKNHPVTSGEVNLCPECKHLELNCKVCPECGAEMR